MSREIAVVRAFTEAFLTRRLDDMVPLLLQDCHDRNPYPLQPAGAGGVLWKAAMFHALYEGFTSSFDDFKEEEARVVALWTTTFPNGVYTRWRGRFVVADERIADFEVERVG
ncbi:MAG: nuclear transport factor 2 family protein [Polyangiaceae bacterium]